MPSAKDKRSGSIPCKGFAPRVSLITRKVLESLLEEKMLKCEQVKEQNNTCPISLIACTI